MNKLVPLLKGVKARGKGQWMACCPAHDDKDPSLAVRETDDGRVLVRCFAGCEASAVVSSVGLTLSDLFPETDKHQLRPFAFAEIERRQKAQVSSRIDHERMVIALAQADREAGKKLSKSDMDRERKAFLYLRSQGIEADPMIVVRAVRSTG